MVILVVKTFKFIGAVAFLLIWSGWIWRILGNQLCPPQRILSAQQLHHWRQRQRKIVKTNVKKSTNAKTEKRKSNFNLLAVIRKSVKQFCILATWFPRYERTFHFSPWKILWGICGVCGIFYEYANESENRLQCITIPFARSFTQKHNELECIWSLELNRYIYLMYFTLSNRALMHTHICAANDFIQFLQNFSSSIDRIVFFFTSLASFHANGVSMYGALFFPHSRFVV